MKVKLINPPIDDCYGRELLKLRGVEDVDFFLNPDESALQDWNDLENITEAVIRIQELSLNAKIAIIVDCDVDGYTSAAIIGQYLSRIRPEAKITYYIHEGKAHGLEEHWEDIRDSMYEMVIIPDAGSNDAEYAEKISSKILVIDHHIVEVPPAPNMIVVNNQSSPKYRNKNLSGAGMAYQFCRALDKSFGVNYADDYIDLAALGVCGDMMSGLEVENQYLWKKGFSKINNYFFLTLARKREYSITGEMSPSLNTLYKALNPTTVAFYIVPLINAMVRVGTLGEKRRMFEAFLDGHGMIPSLKRGEKGQLAERAVESTRECTNAHAHQDKAKKEAVARLESKINKQNLLNNEILFVVLDNEDQFPAPLNGLIAMMLSQKYKKPTIVARLNNEGMVRGSIRGLSNSALGSFKDYLDSTGLFEYVQGHDNAAGASIANIDIPRLHEKANEQLRQYSLSDDYYEVDFERQAYSKDLCTLIEDLAYYKDIWSQGCTEPLVYIKDLHVRKSEIQQIGKDGNTLRLCKNGITYIKFFARDLIESLMQVTGDSIKLEIVGKANLNHWNGTVTPQIFIEQVDIKEDNLLDF